MTRQQFWQIKRYFKLNMGFKEKRPGTEGYNSCAKYDYIYLCVIHNMAFVTDRQTWIAQLMRQHGDFWDILGMLVGD